MTRATEQCEKSGRMTEPLRHNRDFMVLWSGQLVSALGSAITTVAFPLLVLSMTGSPARAGVVGFAGTLPFLLFQLPAGGLVDRWDRRRTMITADVARGLALASVAVAYAAGVLTVAQIAAVAFVEGTMFVLFTVAEGAALPHVVTAEQLPTALAHNEARTRGATLAGQSLGGVLFGLGHAVPFVADALSYAASVVSLLFVRRPLQDAHERRGERLHRELAEGLVWLWGQPFLRATALLVAGSNFVFQAMVLVVIVLAQGHGASPAAVGVIMGMMGAGGLLGALAAPWANRHVRAKSVVIGANWVWAALLPLVAIVPWPLAIGGLIAGMAFVGPAWNVVISAYSLTLTPDRLRGRVRGVQGLIAWGPIPLGSLVGGVLLQWLGGTAATLVLAALMLLVAVAATLSPAVRHAPPLGAAVAAAAVD
jgi:predicted MFS family arabinose efflux permease